MQGGVFFKASGPVWVSPTRFARSIQSCGRLTVRRIQVHNLCGAIALGKYMNESSSFIEREKKLKAGVYCTWDVEMSKCNSFTPASNKITGVHSFSKQHTVAISEQSNN